ncbi:hypothetical protein [Marinobacterium litorale]|uniref:hypothetical protein n=1 Tax=Marinobacterium litorale TaxID=404770 RepID=UPI0004878F94|nr:hypothetical protein [Marinobacterium litorale]
MPIKRFVFIYVLMLPTAFFMSVCYLLYEYGVNSTLDYLTRIDSLREYLEIGFTTAAFAFLLSLLFFLPMVIKGVCKALMEIKNYWTIHQINKIKDLKEKGVFTEEEYNEKLITMKGKLKL